MDAKTSLDIIGAIVLLGGVIVIALVVKAVAKNNPALSVIEPETELSPGDGDNESAINHAID
jgi:hypothetical protein